LVVVAAACRTPSRSAETPEALALLLSQGDFDRATRDFGDYSVSWSHLGEHRRFWNQDPQGAESAFRRAIDAPLTTDASLAFSWRGLGEIARGRGELDRALGCFEKSLAIHPLADTHRSLSAFYATEKRDFEKAARHARAAIELSPEDPIALLQYAVQMERFKKPREAKEAFDRAIRLAGCDERGRSESAVHCCVLYNAACYHAVRGDKAGALAMLKEFFISPNHRHITKEEILRDPDFESLVRDADFTSLLDYRLPEE
jgi:tetratricopeptide (TPR) repeat protein